MSDVDARIAANVSRLAEQYGITLKSLAFRMQMPYRTVQNYLTGNVKIPAVFIEQACDVFGVEADFIIYGVVDIDVECVESAVEKALGRIIRRLQFDGREIKVLDEEYDYLSEKTEKMHNQLVVGEMSAIVREEYIKLRTELLQNEGRRGVHLRKRAIASGTVKPTDRDL